MVQLPDTFVDEETSPGFPVDMHGAEWMNFNMAAISVGAFGGGFDRPQLHLAVLQMYPLSSGDTQTVTAVGFFLFFASLTALCLCCGYTLRFVNANGTALLRSLRLPPVRSLGLCVLMETDTEESLSQSDTQWPFLFAARGRTRVRFMSTSTCLLFAACVVDLENCAAAPSRRALLCFCVRPVIFSQSH